MNTNVSLLLTDTNKYIIDAKIDKRLVKCIYKSILSVIV